ncbi:hypothetical protein DXG01_005158 [Tephrocybe rancida]|nr:hypothetical protein DXG01_005158 [Tephrocybe rancida]
MPAERTPTKSVKAPHSSFQPKTPTRVNPRRKASDKARVAATASECVLADAQHADIDNTDDKSHDTTYAEMRANYHRVDAQRREVSEKLAVQAMIVEEMATQLASAKEELVILQGEKDDEVRVRITYLEPPPRLNFSKANAVQRAQISQLLSDLDDVQLERNTRTQERNDLAANARRLQPIITAVTQFARCGICLCNLSRPIG